MVAFKQKPHAYHISFCGSVVNAIIVYTKTVITVIKNNAKCSGIVVVVVVIVSAAIATLCAGASEHQIKKNSAPKRHRVAFNYTLCLFILCCVLCRAICVVSGVLVDCKNVHATD